VVFDRRAKAGGLNEFGIAAYKVANGFAQREVAFIMALGGIELRTGIELGQDVHLQQLQHEFDAVFLGIGLAGINGLKLPGEDLDGVLNAVDWIEQLRQADDKASVPVGRDVVVIGGGNTAIDVAIQSRRLGAENVTIAYRRGPAQMSATEYEQELAQLNGVGIKHWVRPVRLLGDGFVTGVELEYTQLDERSRLSGTGDTFPLRADMVFKAIGQVLVASDLNGSTELPALRQGKIAIGEHLMTSLEGVFAGGDAASHGQEDLTVVAVQDGKLAAQAIHRYLMG
jgi:glutamate synthase (NADPH/NADH) small chain